MAMLDIKHLTTEFTTENGVVRAVRDVSLHVEKGEVLGIVGESGSGKSQTMFSVMGLLARNGTITNGSIKIDGEEISPAVIKDRKEYESKMDTDAEMSPADDRKSYKYSSTIQISHTPGYTPVPFLSYTVQRYVFL